MSTYRTSILAYVAVASLGAAATSLTASDAAAGFLCSRPFAATAFSGPRYAAPAAPAYRQKAAARKASPAYAKSSGAAAVKVARHKPVAAPDPVKLASTAGAANVAEAAGAANAVTDMRTTTCLAKQYLETGAVMFKDACTNEWAINSTTATGQAASAAGRTCLTKENHPDGVVMFRDTCTNEWAMNTAERETVLPQTR
ncbi:MAG TPA: hypothetical protein VH397_03195 [Xanthobacteraceae bacterium]|jgi:hypothetical protein